MLLKSWLLLIDRFINLASFYDLFLQFRKLLTLQFEKFISRNGKRRQKKICHTPESYSFLRDRNNLETKSKQIASLISAFFPILIFNYCTVIELNFY